MTGRDGRGAGLGAKRQNNCVTGGVVIAGLVYKTGDAV